jgi:hypothetical protein
VVPKQWDYASTEHAHFVWGHTHDHHLLSLPPHVMWLCSSLIDMFVFKLGFAELCVVCAAWLAYTFLVVCGTSLSLEWDRVRREKLCYSTPRRPRRAPPTPPPVGRN